LVEILDEDWLYRRLHSACFRGDGTVSSAAFKTNKFPDEQASVDLAKLTTPTESVNRDGKGYRKLGQLQAGGPRALGLNVVHDPLEDNHAHSLICRVNSTVMCKKLARLVQVIPGIESKT
jgi:hypothetical protein